MLEASCPGWSGRDRSTRSIAFPGWHIWASQQDWIVLQEKKVAVYPTALYNRCTFHNNYNNHLHLSHALVLTKHFHIYSLEPQNNCVTSRAVTMVPIGQKKKQRFQELSNLPKVTEQVRSRSGTWEMRSADSQPQDLSILSLCLLRIAAAHDYVLFPLSQCIPVPKLLMILSSIQWLNLSTLLHLLFFIATTLFQALLSVAWIILTVICHLHSGPLQCKQQDDLYIALLFKAASAPLGRLLAM